MAKIRSVKPNLFTSAQVANCSRNARLLFIGLWVFSDDAGVHPASPHTLRLEVFPGDNEITTEKTAAYIDELIKNRLIMEYEMDSERYWYVTGWKKHQKIARPNYRYPLPKEIEKNTRLNGGENISNQRLSADEAMLEYSRSTVETVSKQCLNTPGNGNGNGDGNGKDICRVAEVPRPQSSRVTQDDDNKNLVEKVFDYWRATLNHPKAILDSKRKQTIKQALKNYNLEQLKQAILGCSQSPFHMGENKEQKFYDDITLILRSASHIENFIAIANNKGEHHSAQRTIIDNNIFAGAI